MPTANIRSALTTLLAVTLLLGTAPAHAADYDLVIHNGRVMNPANGLDSVRDVGIRDGRIAALSREPLSGAAEVDATEATLLGRQLNAISVPSGDQSGE